MSLPRALNLPPVGWTLAGLLAFYVLAGLLGHDPWKSEDVIHIAVARDLLDSAHAPGLALAGEPFLSAPLFYWSAAATGVLFRAWLPLHDALRLASGFWMVLTLMALYHAAREQYGQESAAAAPLLLAGSLGLIVCAHEAQPMLVLLAAVSLQRFAVSLAVRKPRAAAVWCAAALVLGGAGAGLPGIFLLLLIFLSVFGLGRRERFTLLAGMACGLALLVMLAVLLAWAMPQWFSLWRAHELAGFPLPNYAKKLAELLKMQPWFAWPLWPLACWSLWRARKRGQWRQTGLLQSLGGIIFLALGLPLVLPVEEHTALLLLPPLALLATPGALNLRRGAANAFDWFSGMAFSVFVVFLWLGWSAMVLGWPQRLAARSEILNPGFSGAFQPFFFLLALVATLWWIWSLASLPRSPYRCLTRWSLGLVMVWLLAASLWLPWIDYRKSYRSLAREVASHLPQNLVGRTAAREDCIIAWNLGVAQQASLAYFEGLRFQRAPVGERGRRCRWLLLQNARADTQLDTEDWRKVWEGRRASDRRELFQLYQRREQD